MFITRGRLKFIVALAKAEVNKGKIIPPPSFILAGGWRPPLVSLEETRPRVFEKSGRKSSPRLATRSKIIASPRHSP